MQIWVIDNSVPIERLMDSQIKTGALPADRESLQHLVPLDSGIWKSDSQIQELCRQLLAQEDVEVLVFPHPQSTLQYLEQNPNRPDIVFFDWDFGDGKGGVDSPNQLRRLYDSSFFLTQIFSTKPKEEIQRAIDANPELKALQPLLLEVQEKGKADLKKIIANAEEFYTKDFGAFADPVRRAVTVAVENSLRELGALPVKEAVEALGQKKEKDGTERGDGRDVAEILGASLVAALQDASLSKAGDDSELKEMAIQAISARAKALIEENADVLKKLKTLAEKPGKLDATHRQAIRRLSNFKMYHRPGDGFVRQGDIARIVKSDKSSDDALFLILNASCDLERCRGKTREIVTALVLHPLTKEVGFAHLARGENAFDSMGSDITVYKKSKGKASEGAIFFPNIASGKPGDLVDYVGIAQEVVSLRAKAIDLKPTAKLTYKSVLLPGDSRLELVCTLNFTLVPAVIGVVTKAMAGYGFPDLHGVEIDRITKLIS